MVGEYRQPHLADTATKTLTWIPRDLWCPSLSNRVNRAFARGGVAGLIAALNELAFPCDHGLVLRRSATERAAMSLSVEVPVDRPLDFWYPLHPTIEIHGPRKPVIFRPPSERLEGDRIHEWVGARKRIKIPRMLKGDTDRQRMRRQQIFLKVLLAQNFDFSSVLADGDLVRISGEEALKELASIDLSWRMNAFSNTRSERIDGKSVLVKRSNSRPLMRSQDRRSWQWS